MSLSFSEAKLEQAIIELLQDQGYQHLIGDNVPRSSLDQVIIEDDLRHYLAARYQPDGITARYLTPKMSRCNRRRNSRLPI